MQRALDADPDTLRLAPSRADSHGQELSLAPGIAAPFQPADPQFDRGLPYACYDWEVFFHTPMMVAHGLATHQRYGEALRWLHTIFDPTANDGTQRRWWRFPPFAAAGAGSGIDMLLADFAAGRLDPQQQALFQAQVDFSRGSPFRPHGIARMRPRAYQWMVVLQYLDVLIAWGDQQFRRDTIESINEATQLYLLAAELLGRRPTQLPPRPPPGQPPTFASLALAGHPDNWVPLTDTPFFKQLVAWLLELVQHGMGPGSPVFDTMARRVYVLMSTQSLTFCVPRNDRLDRYWDLVEDRLVKIRGSQTIDGLHRRLALFEPKIDPAVLVQAVAAGLDINSVLNETFAPPTPYRFSVALALAEEFTAEVKTLGAALLSALEKRDAEDLARLRSTQELSMLKLVGEFRQRQHDEAAANLTALRQSRASAEVRYRHYQRLLGKEAITTPAENDPVAQETPRLQLGASTSDRVDPDLRGFGLTLEEADHLGWLNVGNNYSLISGAVQTAAGILHSVPNVSVGWGAWSVSFGGSNMGSAMGAVGQFFNMLASNASFQASRSSIIAGHQRRYDDWVLQSNTAGKELEAIDKQILAAEIRVDLAAKEISQHQRQQENAKTVDEFMREKFTATELYQWMADRLGEAHSGAYQLAYDLARRAQRSFAFELGGTDPGIVTYGSWDGSHRGLLAGERLALDLKRLKAAYADRNRRELEVTKHVSLAMLDPIALLRLQATGSCEFVVPELTYDLDFAGHYFRRIKTVSVSLPCVVGPYTSVAGTLTLLENTLRASPVVPTGTDQPDYRRDVVPLQSVAISTGSGDTGMFELNFRDERYLPFEGAGAISRWRFELPAEFRAFDYGTITDLVLQIRYTARDGGAALKADAAGRVRSAMAAQNAEIVRGRRRGRPGPRLQPPARVRRRVGQPHRTAARAADHRGRYRPLPVPGRDRYDRTIEIWKVSLYLRGERLRPGPDPPLTVRPPATCTGQDPQPAIPWETLDVSDGAALYEFDLESEVWTPVTVKTGKTQSLDPEAPGAGTSTVETRSSRSGGGSPRSRTGHDRIPGSAAARGPPAVTGSGDHPAQGRRRDPRHRREIRRQPGHRHRLDDGADRDQPGPGRVRPAAGAVLRLRLGQRPVRVRLEPRACPPSPARPTRACRSTTTAPNPTSSCCPAPRTWCPVLGKNGELDDLTTAPGYAIRRYRPRIEGLFARIERWTSTTHREDVHWRSWSRDNLLTLYGKDPNARIYDPADPSRIFSWLICETRDTKGNAVIYCYKAEDGAQVELTSPAERNRGGRDDPRRAVNRYLKRIRYANRVPLLDAAGLRPRFLTKDQLDRADWCFEVVFDYGEHDQNVPLPDDKKGPTWQRRPDPFSTYRPGFEVRTVPAVPPGPDVPPFPGRTRGRL